MQTVPLTEQRTVPSFGPGTKTGMVACSIHGFHGDFVEATVFCCTLGRGGGGGPYGAASKAPEPAQPPEHKGKRHGKHKAVGVVEGAVAVEANGVVQAVPAAAPALPQQPSQVQQPQRGRRSVRASSEATTAPLTALAAALEPASAAALDASRAAALAAAHMAAR